MLNSEFIRATQVGADHLMIVLHGLGDSMEGYRWLAPALQLDWMTYVLVNAPDSYYGGYSWYDFARSPGPGIERSGELLRNLLAEVEPDFPAERIFLFGFSQGCLMAGEIGLTYPKRFAGVIGVSGYFHQPEGRLLALSPVAREQRFLITHGTQDTLIPLAAVRQQVELLQGAGLNIVWREFEKGHTIAGDEIGLIRDFVQKGRTPVGFKP